MKNNLEREDYGSRTDLHERRTKSNLLEWDRGTNPSKGTVERRK